MSESNDIERNDDLLDFSRPQTAETRAFKDQHSIDVKSKSAKKVKFEFSAEGSHERFNQSKVG